jgi:hypothetical protein
VAGVVAAWLVRQYQLSNQIRYGGGGGGHSHDAIPFFLFRWSMWFIYVIENVYFSAAFTWTRLNGQFWYLNHFLVIYLLNLLKNQSRIVLVR